MRRHAPEPPSDPRPSLVRHGPRHAKAVVLVLHGGKAVSREVSMSTHLSVLRMLPFAWAVRRRTLGKGVAVWRLRYRYRGWNGSEASPVVDARWALDQVRSSLGPVPVVLLGHSMGGRTAARVADDPLVTDAVLLAPWLPEGEPVDGVRGKRVCVLHGDRDVVTSAASSARWTERARAAGAEVSLDLLPGAEHFMLRGASRWHRLATRAVLAGLASKPRVPALR